MLRLHYENETSLPAHASPAVSAVMFSAGVLGNVTALALLVAARRRRRARRERLAPFHVLVLALVVTDLLGTCLTSPVVLAAYWRGRSLEALRPGLCAYFAFAMSFFGLATMGSLGAMALERSLAVGAPYLYARLLRGRRVGLLLGALLLPLLYALAAAFCALPLLGFGRYVQYWPGTWCFIQMREAEGEAPSSGRGSALTYSLLYASLLLLLILAVVLCNLSVIVNLLRMHRRSKHARLAAASSSLRSQRPRSHLGGPDDGEGEGRAPPPGRRRRRAYSARQAPSMSEELDHIILLAIMTITFAVCSLPFTIRAFRNRFIEDGDYKEDLHALRFLSFNSIIDPWVFAILRPPVLRLMRSVLCCWMPLKQQRTRGRPSPSVAKDKPSKQADLLGKDTSLPVSEWALQLSPDNVTRIELSGRTDLLHWEAGGKTLSQVPQETWKGQYPINNWI